ncbi:MAG: NUDIX domain-containing protein [Gaiellaceae bacterium]
MIGVAAKAIVRRPDGRVLVIRRPDDARTDAGLWDLPGGKMDHGETLEQVVVREVREETGLEVQVGGVVHVSYFEFDPFWVTCVTLACDADGDGVRLSGEHVDFAWLAPEEVGERDYAWTVKEQLEAYASAAA